jgi:hypothetical protein
VSAGAGDVLGILLTMRGAVGVDHWLLHLDERPEYGNG